MIQSGPGGVDLGYRATHKPAQGWHTHEHVAFGEQDAVDGLHEHQHQHSGDGAHQHLHVYPDANGDYSPPQRAGTWYPQVVSSGRQGTSATERSAYLTAIDQPVSYDELDPADDNGDPFPELGYAERAFELAERDWQQAREALGEARSRCIQDGTVGYLDGAPDDLGAEGDGLVEGRPRIGSSSASNWVPPVVAGRALSAHARSRLAAFQAAEGQAQAAQRALDQASMRQSQALAAWNEFRNSVGVDAAPGRTGGMADAIYDQARAEPQQRGRPRSRVLDPDGDGLSRVDRARSC